MRRSYKVPLVKTVLCGLYVAGIVLASEPTARKDFLSLKLGGIYDQTVDEKVPNKYIRQQGLSETAAEPSVINAESVLLLEDPSPTKRDEESLRGEVVTETSANLTAQQSTAEKSTNTPTEKASSTTSKTSAEVTQKSTLGKSTKVSTEKPTTATPSTKLSAEKATSATTSTTPKTAAELTTAEKSTKLSTEKATTATPSTTAKTSAQVTQKSTEEEPMKMSIGKARTATSSTTPKAPSEVTTGSQMGGSSTAAELKRKIDGIGSWQPWIGTANPLVDRLTNMPRWQLMNMGNLNARHTKSCKFPFDLLVLQESTNGFGDDLKTMAEGELRKVFEVVKKKHKGSRIGVASFTDKPISPFGFPEHARTYGDWCFRIEADMSTNVKDAEKAYKRMVATGANDFPNNHFGALIQSMNEMKWNKTNVKTQKLILLVADTVPHYSGDGSVTKMPKGMTEFKTGESCIGEFYPSLFQVSEVMFGASNKMAPPYVAVMVDKQADPLVFQTWESIVSGIFYEDPEIFVIDRASDSADFSQQVQNLLYAIENIECQKSHPITQKHTLNPLGDKETGGVSLRCPISEPNGSKAVDVRVELLSP